METMGIKFIEDNSIPINEVRFCSPTGKILGKIVNISSPPPEAISKERLVEEIAKSMYSGNRTVVDGIFNSALVRQRVLSWEECKELCPKDAKENIEQAQAIYKTIQPYLRGE